MYPFVLATTSIYILGFVFQTLVRFLTFSLRRDVEITRVRVCLFQVYQIYSYE